MKKSVAMKWVKALRSGKYRQTAGKLQDYKGYCCLGVLCEVAPEKLRHKDDLFLIGANLFCQPKVRLWSDIRSLDGKILGINASLANKNDNGWSFKRIATFIEKNYKRL
jgi:hypothetical protein